MPRKGHGLTLHEPVLPRDQPAIAAGLDPRFCPLCLDQLTRPGTIFCQPCAAKRKREHSRIYKRAAYRLWGRAGRPKGQG